MATASLSIFCVTIEALIIVEESCLYVIRQHIKSQCTATIFFRVQTKLKSRWKIRQNTRHIYTISLLEINAKHIHYRAIECRTMVVCYFLMIWSNDIRDRSILTSQKVQSDFVIECFYLLTAFRATTYFISH